MQNFSKYLESKRITSKKQATYYLVWVSHFLNHFDKKPTDDFNSEEIDQFLKHLERRMAG